MKTANAYTDTLVSEAHRHHQAGRLVEAEAGYLDALRLQPKHPDALHYLGVLRQQQNDPESAVKLISRAIKGRADVVEMHLNLGAAYCKLGQPARAVFAYRKAIALKPDLAAAHFNLGHALRDSKDFDGAVTAYKTYLETRPDDPAGHLGLGCAYAGLDRFDDAMTEFDTAITFDSEFAEGYYKIGLLLGDQGYFNTSLVFHERVAVLAPDIADWAVDLSLALLRLEQFAPGWLLYERRCDRGARRVIRRPVPPPFWQGENLQGKSILVWMEQGLGDQILYASMLPEIIATAGRCIIECTPRLVPVFARSFPTAEIVGNADLGDAVTPVAGLDYQIAAGSLGQYLRQDRARFPRHAGYLRADQTKVASLRARYEELAQGRRIVGLSWRTRDTSENTVKSIDLAGLAPVLQTPGILFVNLQYGDCRAEMAKVKKQLGVEIFQDSTVDPVADMDIFFAQVAVMDLVITSSNTTAHVAGAQNKPVWILLPSAKGLLWYWFLKREDSPWYPSARLIRADRPMANEPWWSSVAQSAAVNLAAWASGDR